MLTQILKAERSKVISSQYIIIPIICCLQKARFKALNKGSGRFPPCAKYFRSGLHCKSTKCFKNRYWDKVLQLTLLQHQWSKTALQGICVQTLLRPYNVEFSREVTLQNPDFWVMCYIPWVITSQNYEWKRESKLKRDSVIIYWKENTFLSYVKSAFSSLLFQ